MALPFISGILSAIPFVILSPNGAQQSKLSPPLSSLVRIEREFAATSLKEGILSSFMKYFADDGISISPKPHLYKETEGKTPPPANPLARRLYWEPIVADVSSSGDLGYTMGPFSLKDSEKQDAPLWYGFYLSIWKKQKDGTWKVAVDVGTGSTKVVEQYFGQQLTPVVHDSHRSKGKSARGKAAALELLKCEKAFSRSVATLGVCVAYEKVIEVQVRALREGLVPLEGKDAVLAYLVKGTALRSLDPIKADVSRAGDMGYTYGAYREIAKSKDPSGYYVRIWRRDGKGTWKIAFEAASPVE